MTDKKEESPAANGETELAATPMQELPTRWEIELEFVQSLSNIPYVNYLAQQQYLQDPQFINYLKYLTYWQQPQYSKYIVYPNCLHILSLLQSEEFRKNIVNQEFMNTLMNDMVKRWQVDDGKDGVSPMNFEVGNSSNQSNADTTMLETK
ncbi:Mediator of RNA polymerase II transcription subunit 31 [Spathaspora sp. JA1]|nr:Mediator of RNA polymerase II transcription subunit 31 [Spathaspora sp. JA1]